MPKNRSAGIVIKDNKILLMHRIKDDEEYYVIPGGGQEEGENVDETAIREIKEETTIDVDIDRLLYKITWDDGGVNFFYLCKYVSGEPELDENSEEYIKMQEDKNNLYKPMWVDIDKISELILYQLEIRDLLVKELKEGFNSDKQEFFLKLAERRQV
jgi:8-oxo-dGTP pyrophosphatase MutT (NUDIX family)